MKYLFVRSEERRVGKECTALYPHFDWSADGEWLALVDSGFLRLIAPGHDYELYVPHEYRNCTYTGWINP